MPKIFIPHLIPEIGIKMLKEKKYQVIINKEDKVLSKEEMKERVREMDAILSLLINKIDGEIMDAAGKQLKIIANYAVGYDNINLEDAKARNIYVTNTPDVLSDTVAEHTFALILAIAHRIAEGDRFMRAKKYKHWEPLLLLGNDIYQKTLGVIGLGRIGAKVAYHAVKGFDMKVLYYDIKRNEEFEKEYGAIFVPIEEILKNADFISLHVPLLPSTRHLIGKEQLKMMKPTVYLINTSRGAVIDESALVEALKNKIIKGAALDVYENEPNLTPGLIDLDNIILTPHTASATEETRNKMAILAAKNIIEALEGRMPPNNVIR